MSDKEKEAYPSYVTTWGYLKCYDYKQAFKNSYANASKEDRDSVKELPNFDAEIFYEISWIKVDEEPKTELTLKEVAEKLWVPVETLRIKD